MPRVILWLTDARGIYIPRDFASSFDDRDQRVSGVTAEDWETLDAGPDHQYYWETWDDVLNNAVVTDLEGNRYFLNQDGDLWLVPVGFVWDDEDQQWKEPSDEADTDAG